jgi:RNA polymerase sigma-70 factor (ECF subfamily)
MSHNNHTDIGGIRESFLTTHWSFIEAAGAGTEDREKAMIGLLLERYWKPVYCYLRRKGYDNEDAKDLTQGFFQEVVLGRELISQADRLKGRFRTFLLTSLDRYLINVQKAQSTQRRMPRRKLVSLTFEPPDLPETVSELSPEDSFNYAWVSSLLEHVLAEGETACQREGKTTHWAIFNERILQPAAAGTEPPTMSEICRKYGIKSPVKASNMIVTVKRRLQKAFAEYLRNSVTSDEEAADELNEIKRFLPDIAQYSA